MCHPHLPFFKNLGKKTSFILLSGFFHLCQCVSLTYQAQFSPDSAGEVSPLVFSQKGWASGSWEQRWGSRGQVLNHCVPRSGVVCRVKYCNSLPDIPFDPKFITYPFDQNR